jgi:hypothetical protein
MYRAYTRTPWADQILDFAGIVLGLTYSGCTNRKKCLGIVLLNKEDFNPRVIAHEATHMGIDYLRRVNKRALKNLQMPFRAYDNESLAYAVGNCTQQIMEKFNATRLK